VTLLVDTSVWSLSFRRDGDSNSPSVDALRAALAGGDSIVTTGLILQELLQGFAGPRARKEIVERFAALPLLVPDRRDYVDAAELRNRCRRSVTVRSGHIDIDSSIA
jgi:predicted nucleic acid-binding protein